MAARVTCFGQVCQQNNRCIVRNILRWKYDKLLGRAKTTTPSSTISYEVRPERLEEISKSPSGWVQPQKPSPALPFQIQRSKTNNLPVYVDKKRGGSLVLTVIRKIKGDLSELQKFLEQRLGKDVHFQINEVTSQVKIKGYHKDAVVKILKEYGF